MSLPIYPSMTDAEVKKVCSAVKEVSVKHIGSMKFIRVISWYERLLFNPISDWIGLAIVITNFHFLYI